MRLHLGWSTPIVLVLGLILACTVGKEDQTVVNILFIYQEQEREPLFDAAKKFFDNDNSRGIKIGKVHRFNATHNDSLKLINNFCKFFDDAMESDNPPDVAIDFTRIGIPSEGVKIALAGMQMPTIAGTFGQDGDVREWRSLTPAQEKYLIQVSPPADILIQSVRSIVENTSMTSAVVMFNEHDYEMYHKYKSLLQNMPTRHLLTKIDHKNITGQVVRLVHVDIVNFFIAGTIGEITEVLDRASQPGQEDGPYFSDEFAWYSMTLIPADIKKAKLPRCTKCGMEVSLVHVIPDELKASKRKDFLASELKADMTLTDMFYFDLAVDAILAVADLKKKGNYKLNNSNNTCKYFPNNQTVQKYKDLSVDLFTAFQTAAKENGLPFYLRPGKPGQNRPHFTASLYRLFYNPNTTDPRGEKTKIGTWTSGFEDGHKLIVYEPGRSLEPHLAHTVFRIVTFEQHPFVFYNKSCNTTGKENKYKNCFYGYCIDLLEKIKSELKFNYTIKNVTTGYGYMNATDDNHGWDGMVLELQKRRADIALGAMSVMAERESVVDFTVPYYDLVGISILMKKPKVPTSLFKFLTVLENDVWMCILGAYFFTSFLMWVFDRWSPYSYQNNREKYEDDEEKREFNLKECLWFCMTSLTPQGGGEAPKNLSGRLVAATWWLFGFIIIASYTANLAAFLTVSRLDAPIESLEDLSKQYKIQYAPMKGSSAWIYFDRMAHIEHRFYEIWKDMSLNDSMTDFERSQLAVWDYPVSDKYTKMWQAMTENKPPENFSYAVERVRAVNHNDSSKEKDGFAFLGDATDIRFQVLTNCDLQMVGEEFSRKPYALAVQQGSPLKDQLNDVILKLLNQRYLEQLKENWWNNDTYKVKCEKDDNQSDGISIHNIGGVFIVIFVGIVMACFTLIFEYWWYRKRNVSEELAEMALPPPKEFGSTFTTTPPTIEKTNFNTQYDKPPERTTLPSIENSW